MTDTPAQYTNAQRRVLTALGGLGVAALAGATFVLSYDDLRTLAIRGGAVRHRAFLYPGIVDGLVTVVILSLLAARRASWWSRAVRWLLLLLLIAGAGAAGVDRAVDHYRSLPHHWVSGGVAAAPWAILLIAVWLWISMIKQVLRTRRDRPTARAGGVRHPSGTPDETAGGTVMDGDIVPWPEREEMLRTRPLPRSAAVREPAPARPGGTAAQDTAASAPASPVSLDEGGTGTGSAPGPRPVAGPATVMAREPAAEPDGPRASGRGRPLYEPAAATAHDRPPAGRTAAQEVRQPGPSAAPHDAAARDADTATREADPHEADPGDAARPEADPTGEPLPDAAAHDAARHKADPVREPGPRAAAHDAVRPEGDPTGEPLPDAAVDDSAQGEPNTDREPRPVAEPSDAAESQPDAEPQPEPRREAYGDAEPRPVPDSADRPRHGVTPQGEAGAGAERDGADDVETTAPRMIARSSLPTDVRLVGPPVHENDLGDTQPDGIKLPDTDPDGIPLPGAARRTPARTDRTGTVVDTAGRTAVDAEADTDEDWLFEPDTDEPAAGPATDAVDVPNGRRESGAGEPATHADPGEPVPGGAAEEPDAGADDPGPTPAPPPPSGTFRSSPTPPRRRG